MSRAQPGRLLRRAGLILLVVLCGYLVVRAIVEIVMVAGGDRLDPTDWGGPTSAGILAVHSLPGLVGAIVIGWLLRRRGARRT